jgi:hypothetical protein
MGRCLQDHHSDQTFDDTVCLPCYGNRGESSTDVMAPIAVKQKRLGRQRDWEGSMIWKADGIHRVSQTEGLKLGGRKAMKISMSYVSENGLSEKRARRFEHMHPEMCEERTGHGGE